VDISSDMYELRYFSPELVFEPSERQARGATLVAMRKGKGKYFKMQGSLESVEDAAEFCLSVLRGEANAKELEGQYFQAAHGLQKGDNPTKSKEQEGHGEL